MFLSGSRAPFDFEFACQGYRYTVNIVQTVYLQTRTSYSSLYEHAHKIVLTGKNKNVRKIAHEANETHNATTIAC